MSEYRRKHSVPAEETLWSAAPSAARASNQFSRQRNRPSGRRRTAPKPYESFSSFSEFSDDDSGSQQSSQAYVGYTVAGTLRRRSPVATIVMAVVAVVMLGLLVFGGVKLAQAFGLFGTTTSAGGEEVSIFIPEGSTTTEIAGILRKAGVIAGEGSFINAVVQRGVGSSIQPGRYTLRTGMSDSEAIEALTAGPGGAIGPSDKLTIPEGFTLEATAARVEKVCGIPAADFIAEAHSADKYVTNYPFLEGVYDNSMEGFLYPKTYMIPKGSSAGYVISVLLDQFAIETEGLDLSYAAEHNLTLYDLVIMGSMIEKETAVPAERPIVSSVLYNRLQDGMPLQICATVVYALGYEDYDGHPLLESDLAIDSPYNTYQNYGLPVGPICSPRLESIEAAAHPEETDKRYLYYVLTSNAEDMEERTHTFCETWEQFEEANAVYHELYNVAG